MKARWVLHNPSPKMPMIGHTIVAKWWPGRYFMAMTFQRDSSSPLARLTQSIEQHVSYGEATPSPERYLTQVFRCDKDGAAYSVEEPIFEREYSQLSAAREGHKDVVQQLELGQL